MRNSNKNTILVSILILVCVGILAYTIDVVSWQQSYKKRSWLPKDVVMFSLFPQRAGQPGILGRVYLYDPPRPGPSPGSEVSGVFPFMLDAPTPRPGEHMYMVDTVMSSKGSHEPIFGYYEYTSADDGEEAMKNNMKFFETH